MNDISIVCVLRSGGEYSFYHVYVLKNMVKRNLYCRYPFICLTDFIPPKNYPYDLSGIDFVPFEHNWPGWWAKMEAFRPGLGERILYLDLDVCLIRNCDDLINLTGNFLLLRDPGNLTINTAVELYDHSAVQWIYDGFCADAWMHMKEFVSDQQYLQSKVDQALLSPEFIEDYLPDQVVSYKKQWRSGDCNKKNVRMIYFHGNPRPWQAEDPVVRENYV
jgi:hypothetical protein